MCPPTAKKWPEKEEVTFTQMTNDVQQYAIKRMCKPLCVYAFRWIASSGHTWGGIETGLTGSGM